MTLVSTLGDAGRPYKSFICDRSGKLEPAVAHVERRELNGKPLVDRTRPAAQTFGGIVNASERFKDSRAMNDRLKSIGMNR